MFKANKCHNIEKRKTNAHYNIVSTNISIQHNSNGIYISIQVNEHFMADEISVGPLCFFDFSCASTSVGGRPLFLVRILFCFIKHMAMFIVVVAI